MKKLILLTLLFNLNAFSNVQQGDMIKAVEYNNSKFTVGDIKHSVLSLTDFQSLHGSCWIQLNNTTTNDISIENTNLAGYIGNTIKSASGRVLRAAGSGSAALREQQEDATAVNGLSSSTNPAGSHQHDFVFERDSNVAVGTPPYQYLGSSGANVLEVRSGGDRTVVNSVRPSGEHTHSVNITSSDTETRMKNLTINLFLKVNHNCN